MVRLVTALLFSIILSSPASASDRSPKIPLKEYGDALSIRQREMLEQDFEAFFADPSQKTIEQIRNWRENFLSFEFVLQKLRAKLDQDNLSPRVWRLGGPFLIILAAKIENCPRFLAPIPRERIHLHLRPLLFRYKNEPELVEPIVRIYDHYDLWGYGDYWYLRQNLERAEDIGKVWQRVNSLIPVLNKNETKDMVKLLRRNYQNETMALYLALNAEQRLSAELSPESVFDLSYVFLETYREFCAALVESRKMILGAFRKHRGGGRNRFVNTELAAYMEFYQQGNTSVKAAYEAAKAKAQWIAQRDHYHRDGLIFFDLFEAGKLDWQDPEHWHPHRVKVEKTSEMQPAKQLEAPSESRGVVISVDFKNRVCAPALMKKDGPDEP